MRTVSYFLLRRPFCTMDQPRDEEGIFVQEMMPLENIYIGLLWPRPENMVKPYWLH